MVFNAQDLSRFEFCARYPQINRIYEPPRWPIRDAMKRWIQSGIRHLVAGEGIDLATTAFIESAANPGFEYPGHAEPYILANDYASWLDGALHLIQDSFALIKFKQVPLIDFHGHIMHVDAWTDGEVIHIFRIAANLGERKVRWPELAIMAACPEDVQIHVLRLPSVRDGRLASPLCMGYQHPTIPHLQIRLAKLEDGANFGKNWKKVGRWELQPSCTWEEWYRGIERDKCLDQLVEHFHVGPILDGEKERIIFDVEHMAEVMERPDLHPRFREACQSCVFTGLCHGDEDSRSRYQVNHEALEKYNNKIAQIALDRRQ